MQDLFNEKRISGKRTGDLTKELSAKSDLATFLQENKSEFITPDIGELITDLLKAKGMTKADLARRSCVSEVYLYQVLSGRRTPSRDRMICICFGLQCTLEETQELLRRSRFAVLYSKVRREAVIMYALEEKWSVAQLNDMLFEIEEETMY